MIIKIINKAFKARILFISMLLSLPSLAIAQSAAEQEEVISSEKMEKAISNISVTLDKVVSGLYTGFGKVVSDTSEALGKAVSNTSAARDKATEPASFETDYISGASCRPVLHGDFLANTEYLTLTNEKHTFRIDLKGNLNTDTKAQSLTDSQSASLNAYQKMIRNDLVFLHNYLKTEITDTWKTFDSLFAKELGEKSQLRSELKAFHDKLQQDIGKGYSIKDDVVYFDHKVITAVVAELEKSIPAFISSISVRGFSDIASLSANESNKITFIAQKVKSLQEQFVASLKKQRSHAAQIKKNLCNRFANWQKQEQTLREQISTLASWRSVSFEKKS